MLRVLFWFLTVTLTSGTAAIFAASTNQAEVQAYIERYIGSWKGEMSIETVEGEVLKTLPLAAEYWKANGSIKGLTAFEMEGDMTFVESTNYFRNGLLFADVEQKGEVVTYRGFLKDNLLIWIPYDAELNTERQMKERFSEEGGREVLFVDGVELIRSEKGTAKVLLRAKMFRD